MYCVLSWREPVDRYNRATVYALMPVDERTTFQFALGFFFNFMYSSLVMQPTEIVDH